MAVLDARIEPLQEQKPEAAPGFGVRGTGDSIRGRAANVEPLEAAPPDLLVPGVVRLGTLVDARLRVVAPIEVRLFEDHGHVVAEATALNEYGFGSNASEALRDVQRAVAQLYISLSEERERLGPDLLATWSILERSVVPYLPAAC